MAAPKKLPITELKLAKIIERQEADAEILDLIDSRAEAFLNSKPDIVMITTRNSDGDTSWFEKPFSRREVYKIAQNMGTDLNIATIFGLDQQCLKKHFAKEIKLARAIMRDKMKAVNTRAALDPKNIPDRLFWLKNFASMSDNGSTEELGEAEEAAVFKVVAPVKPVFPDVTKDTVEDMLQVIESGKDL